MLIRKFELRDSIEVSKLIRNAILNRDNRGYTIEQIFSICNHHSGENMMLDFDKKIGHVGIIDGKIIGVSMLREGEVTKVFIDPEYQGRGIGKQLMNLIEKEAINRGIRKLWLISSLPAIKFYENLGWKTVGDFFHEKWGKAVRMEKEVIR
ncbi:GNAT family N-acetyltransferase [Candidatus Pacearchaeota archaeon]|nr:GNAT family N-acetyltransferase [Candidatus Pacearchaeota archaeon]